MSGLRNRFEEIVDAFMEKTFGVRGWSWHHKNKVRMMRSYPRFLNSENIDVYLRDKRDERLAHLGMAFGIGLIIGLSIGFVHITKTYTSDEAIKQPAMIQEVQAESLPVQDFPRLPVARERVQPSVYREVVAYTSRESETDGSPCISADGSNICELWQDGKSVCAANFVPFGTELVIDGVTTCTVHDRMNSRYQNRVDIYLGYDLQRALQFGVQVLPVTTKYK